MNIQVSYNWLKEYTKTSKTPEQVADLLSLHSMSVEYSKDIEGEKVFDIEITTNRPDCASVVGLARELSVLLGKKFKEYSVKLPKTKPGDFKIKIEDKTKCQRYMGAILENVEVKPSSKTIQKRLIQAGLRPINNVVDITNYVMLETGNPMHAFDAGDDLSNIIVRPAKVGEAMVTLDNQKLDLTKDDLLITDKEKILGLAGIKGGKEREVNPKTKRIVLESANFNPGSIRGSSQRHSLITDASVRFTKDISADLAEVALVRALELLEKEAGAKLVDLVDQGAVKTKNTSVVLTKEKMDGLLGMDFSLGKAKTILGNLGFKIVNSSGKRITATVPWWRCGDVALEEDLVEEIARVYGYHNLPSQPLVGGLPEIEESPRFKLEIKTKELLQHLGFTECYTYSLTSEKNSLLLLKNPLNKDFAGMRRDLTMGLLEAVAKNERKVDALEIFELSKVYVPVDSGLPQEITRLSVLKKEEKFNPKTFYNLKAILERVTALFGVSVLNYKRIKNCNIWQAGDSAEVYANGELIGVIGWLGNQATNQAGVKNKVAGFDISFDWLVKNLDPNKRFKQLPKFPGVRRDLSLIIPRKKIWQVIEENIRANGKPYLRKIEVFDVYTGKGVPKGYISVACHLEFRHNEQTLKDQEVDRLVEGIINSLKDQGVSIRN